jgi:FAD/FMN-containing dehydrogenase
LADAELEDILPDEDLYQDRVDVHWSLAARLSPSCFVMPRNAGEVAKVVTTLVEANKTQPCEFAIRSGGHQTWAGAANIVEGVTLDLGSMNSTIYNPENKTASVQPGSRWKGVYETLDALGVAAAGGRASTVGVAGLATGGGNSFYGAREGFVCDNVVRFEVRYTKSLLSSASLTIRRSYSPPVKSSRPTKTRTPTSGKR